MKKMKLVIFDMDGLMFDTEALSNEGWKAACSKYGYKLTDEFFLQLIGRNMQGVEQHFKEYFGTDVPYQELEKLWENYNKTTVEEKGLPIKPGLYELVEYLDYLGVARAMATSSNREKAMWYLKLAGLTDQFQFVICGNEVSRGKPEPDIFLLAAEKMGCDPKECVVLEDSENGIRAAYRAGMIPIMIPDFKQPSKEIEKMLYKKFNSLSEYTDELKQNYTL